MMSLLRPLRVGVLAIAPVIAAGWITVSARGAVAAIAQSGAQNAYTVYTPEGRRTLAVRSMGGADMVALDQLAGTFGLTIVEDSVLRGLVINTRGERILAIPGQSFVQVAGKVVSLSAAIQRDRSTWYAPIDFLSQALGPATNQRIIVRRPSRLVLVGEVRVPQISGRLERTASSGRLVLDIQPSTAHRITREGNRLTVRFEAAALDFEPIADLGGEFVTAARVEGPTLVLELGPSAATFRTEDEPTRLAIELLPPGPPPAPPTPAPAPPLPPLDPTPGIRTVVIDPGHGGDDAGATGPGDLKEKDLTLQLARRLKAAIESRMGLRVLLTRDSDENVPIDQRTSLANNSKADVFISLHANASSRPDVRGAQVLSLSIADYRSQPGAEAAKGLPVPTVAGNTRLIQAVPWDLAQLPFADRSAALGALLVRHLTERAVPLYSRPAAQLPLRVLVGANMPAVLLEVGFLSNAADAKALGGDTSGAILEALLQMIGDVRRGIPSADGSGARQ